MAVSVAVRTVHTGVVVVVVVDVVVDDVDEVDDVDDVDDVVLEELLDGAELCVGGADEVVEDFGVVTVVESLLTGGDEATLEAVVALVLGSVDGAAVVGASVPGAADDVGSMDDVGSAEEAGAVRAMVVGVAATWSGSVVATVEVVAMLLRSGLPNGSAVVVGASVVEVAALLATAGAAVVVVDVALVAGPVAAAASSRSAMVVLAAAAWRVCCWCTFQAKTVPRTRMTTPAADDTAAARRRRAEATRSRTRS